MNAILIIDDNKEYRIDLMEILEIENYQTLGAENGQIGLQMIRDCSPSLVICDVDMPIMGGLEVLKATKADSTLCNIPFLMISGNTDQHTQKTAHNLGVHNYLTKPFIITEFLVAVGRVLIIYV